MLAAASAAATTVRAAAASAAAAVATCAATASAVAAVAVVRVIDRSNGRTSLSGLLAVALANSALLTKCTTLQEGVLVIGC